MTSWSEFERWHGGWGDRATLSYLPFAVRGFFDNGGRRAYIARVHPSDGAASSITLPTGAEDLVLTALGPGDLDDRLFAWVGPASGRGRTGPGQAEPARFRLVLVHDDEAPRQFVGSVDASLVEDFDDLDLDPNSPSFVLTALRRSTLVTAAFDPPTPTPSMPLATGVAANGDRTYVAATGGHDGAAAMGLDDFIGTMPTSTSRGSGLRGLATIDEVALLAAPDEANPNVAATVRTGLRDAVVLQCEQLRDRFAILQLPQHAGGGKPGHAMSAMDSSYAGAWHPWVRVLDPATQATYAVPAHGHVAGVYARNDLERGVHTAPGSARVHGVVSTGLPGNEGLRSPLITRQQEEVLVASGVNLLRDGGAGRPGVTLWGARTLSDDPEWKYVNVRRLVIFIERSIERGTRWAVFEPNVEATWARVRASIEDFLTGLWRRGALVGTAPDKAFFVRCDRTTMTANDIDDGRLICIVGIAPTKPAEFVVVRCSARTIEAP